MNELTAADQRALRARAHHLRPVVMIGNGGLTPEVTKEIDAALKSHELIKIRVLGDERAAREALTVAICQATGSQAVQQIGKILVVFRPKPPEEHKPAKRRPRGKPQRRTKQSYQNR